MPSMRRAAPFFRPAVVVAPHPDDETFGCGGVIAEKRARGVPVRVVFVTDGGRSHGSLEVQRMRELVARRRREAIAALGILGVAEGEAVFLDLPDGEASAVLEETRKGAIAAIAGAVSAVRAEELFVTFRADGHADHRAAYALAREAARGVAMFEYPIWVDHGIGRGAAVRARAVCLPAAAMARKRAAIAVYASQLEVLPAGFAARFTKGWEVFFGRP